MALNYKDILGRLRPPSAPSAPPSMPEELRLMLLAVWSEDFLLVSKEEGDVGERWEEFGLSDYTKRVRDLPPPALSDEEKSERSGSRRVRTKQMMSKVHELGHIRPLN